MKNTQQPKVEPRLGIGLPTTFNAQYPGWVRTCHAWMLNVECWLLNVPKVILISAVRVYQLTISPLQTFLFGATGGCRYTPSCSAYAVEALHEHGVLIGTAMAAKRICRCHPWGGCGHDPVPPRQKSGAQK